MIMHADLSRPVRAAHPRAVRHGPSGLDPRLELLEQVGARLAAAQDASRCLEVVAQALVPRLAAACRFELAAAAGSPGWHWGEAAAAVEGRAPVLEVPLCARGSALGRLLVWRGEGVPGLCALDAWLVRRLAERAALALDAAQLWAEARAARHQAQQAGGLQAGQLRQLGDALRNPLAPLVATLELMALRYPGQAVAEREIMARQLRQLVQIVDAWTPT